MFLALFWAPLFAVESADDPDTVGIGTDGRSTKKILKLLKTIEKDTTILCGKERYRLEEIENLLRKSSSDPSASIEKIERLVTETANLYVHDRRYGCLDPSRVFPERIGLDRVERKDTSPKENLLLRRLEQALKFYETIDANGGWTPVKTVHESLRYGESDPAVPLLRARLAVTGDYPGIPDTNATYDETLVEAVRTFQKRHALKADGILGPKTLAALDIPVSEKIERIRLNIERLRWLTDGSDDFIAVNIPDFSLTLYRKEEAVLRMRVVVGRRERATPMLSDTLTYAVLNPVWRAPRTIVEEDILPKLHAGAFDDLRRAGIYATRIGETDRTVDLRLVDWSLYADDDIPYIFFQKPGPKNYLGVVKFMFPNDFDVYIHDTPHDELFSRTLRTNSSGCIRVEKPIELFHALFNPDGDNEWRYKTILETLMTKKERVVGLETPIPVYILYMTTRVDEKGRVHFYEDVYGYDRIMTDYLNEYEQSE
ncbi:L,D-transpeptidase family protein [Hydrogenimonas sp.]